MTDPIDARGLMTDRGVGRFALDPRAVIGVAIHHSVSGGQFFAAAVQDQDDELSHLLMIDQYHAAQGWGGFGYHAAAFPSGRWYLCGNLNGARAHVASRNHQLVGLVLIGTFTTTTPPPAQIAAAGAGVAFMRRTYLERPIAPHLVWALAEYPTSCPGDTWEQWLGALTASEEGDDELKLLWAKPSNRVFVIGESGKRHIAGPAEHQAYVAAGYGSAEVADAQADAIPDAPAPMRILIGQPSGRHFVLGEGGRRYIDDPAEARAYVAAGWSWRTVPDAELNAIPDVR